jgi:hypothetical protein
MTNHQTAGNVQSGFRKARAHAWKRDQASTSAGTLAAGLETFGYQIEVLISPYMR